MNEDIVRSMLKEIEMLKSEVRSLKLRSTPGNFSANAIPFAGSDGRLDTDLANLSFNDTTNILQAFALLMGVASPPAGTNWSSKVGARNANTNYMEMVPHNVAGGGSILWNCYSVGATGGLLATGNTKYAYFDGVFSNAALALYYDGNLSRLDLWYGGPSTGAGNNVTGWTLIFRFSADPGSTFVATQPWQAPTLLNGWVYFGAPYSTPGYYRDPLVRVHLKGLLKSGTTIAGTPYFTLPAGYRPGSELILPIMSNGALGQVVIDTSGNVEHHVGSAVWISLDGISFRGEN